MAASHPTFALCIAKRGALNVAGLHDIVVLRRGVAAGPGNVADIWKLGRHARQEAVRGAVHLRPLLFKEHKDVLSLRRDAQSQGWRGLLLVSKGTHTARLEVEDKKAVAVQLGARFIPGREKGSGGGGWAGGSGACA